MRASGRVNGSTKKNPKMSVTNPGVSSSVPPTRINAASASSLPGIRPVSVDVRSAFQAHAALALDQPGAERALDQQHADRRPAADHLADLDDHVDLDDRDDQQ